MKNVIIVEGADACGKSQLCEHLKNKVNGKCHIIHSNYDKIQPKSNHLRQHFLIAKFVAKQFSRRYYTGNNLVVLDRNYISDIVYGQIGYGSFGSLSFKCAVLTHLLKMLNKHANVIIIYCNPKKICVPTVQ